MNENGKKIIDYCSVFCQSVTDNNDKIKESTTSESNNNTVISANVSPIVLNKYENVLNSYKKLHIKFVDTLYEKEILKGICEETFVSTYMNEIDTIDSNMLNAL